VELVSILPSSGADGAAWCEGLRWSDANLEEFRPDLPVTLQPAELHRRVAAQIVVYLAGDVAERYAPSGEPPELVPPDYAAAEETAQALAHLSPYHLSLLAAVDATPPGDKDSERAAALARQFVSELARAMAGAEAEAYLHYMAVVARRLILSHRPAVDRLAAALLWRTVIPGGEAVSILRESPEETEHVV
jgi:hypothetical protein